jgi:hypothetical protein
MWSSEFSYFKLVKTFLARKGDGEAGRFPEEKLN